MKIVNASSSSAKAIFLTGASGTLGRALALQHASDGVTFRLWGRDPDKLAQTAKAVRATGAESRQTSLDLNDAHTAVEKLLEQDRAERFELAYLVAGIGDTRPDGAKVEDPELVLRTAQINFSAPAALAAALAERMAERGHGRIVLIGSAASHHSLPFAATYSASKAGLARFADALRLAVKPHGVSITLAAPGFIDTPAARSRSENLPLKLPVDEAARRIVRAGEKGKRYYVTPWPFAILKTVDAMLPAIVRDRILERLEP